MSIGFWVSPSGSKTGITGWNWASIDHWNSLSHGW